MDSRHNAEMRHPLEELSSLEAPTADIDRMLAEIEAGRFL
jgi:hypothetical protein